MTEWSNQPCTEDAIFHARANTFPRCYLKSEGCNFTYDLCRHLDGIKNKRYTTMEKIEEESVVGRRLGKALYVRQKRMQMPSTLRCCATQMLNRIYGK